LIEDNDDVEGSIQDAFNKIADGIAQITSSIEASDEAGDEAGAAAEVSEGTEAEGQAEGEGSDAGGDDVAISGDISAEAAPLSNAKSMTLAQWMEFKQLVGR
jgi:hypothetical protein